MVAIADFNQVNALQRQGIDLCKGCESENGCVSSQQTSDTFFVR